MAIRITCPGCKTSLTLDDEARGTKIRCDECGKALSIPAASKDAIQEGRKLKAKAPAASTQEDEADENERPGKKKKGKKGKAGSPALLFIAGGAVLVVLLIAVGGLSGYFLLRTAPATPKENQQAKLEPKDKKGPEAKNDQKAGGGEPKDQQPNLPVKEKENGNPGIRIAPKIEEGSPTKKGGTGIVQNIRGAAYITERRNELKQLHLSFSEFCDQYKGASRTEANFLVHIKTFGPIHKSVKDGYYKVNMNARMEGASIVAYERDAYHQGYLCVMGDADIRHVPEAEWKAALGIK